MPSWDRQPKESEVAYEAFKTYLSLEGKRSYRLVAKKLSKSSTIIKRWASRWCWQGRTLDYDNNREKKLLATELAEEKKRCRKVIAQKHKIGSHLENYALKMLGKLIEQLEDGAIILNPGMLCTVLEMCFKLQEAEYPDLVDEQSGRKGIFALAESIKALAEKTVEQHGAIKPPLVKKEGTQ
jgi:transposase